MAMKNEIVERIKKDLVSNDGGRYTISPQDFSEIEIPLCESRSRFTYNACDGTFRFIKQTFIHSGGRQWIENWAYAMERRGMVHKDTLDVLANADLQIFQGRFAGCKKKPKRFISSTEAQMANTRFRTGIWFKRQDWLCDCGWLQCLAASDEEIQEGYVELHKYNKDTGKRDRIGERQQLYPVPQNHSMQCINLNWNDVLRNKSDLCVTQEEPPPLYFDNLRKLLDDGTRHHLSFERDEDDDEEME